MKVRARMLVTWDPDTKLRDIASIVGERMEAELRNWHANVMGGHFAPGAPGRYSYKPRNRRYMIRKAKQKGHQNPLVWSGNLKAMVEGLFGISHRGQAPVRARLRLHGPRYLYQYRKDFQQPDKAAELTRLTPDELEAMRARVDAGLTEAVRRRTVQRVLWRS